ncbi:hypothetical protein DI09_4p280 [Mitosporidium daphniae]|uniref:Septin-type G domain-containing protein n=1 Tax=Mitosporidium daphniae TaxID=1485682 RepID=A0A098VPR8_9MICR|nr:uncharacterized protein DI09_4p280 [Mitosporidium daphniae]KGG50945.1 hypothetical protein DI09_4p280 [Mitosporidium daphniae]|eukprot:XP_013237372.1 uncharacterized protein DI09_4p280 [Mitosporidium daphniae]
MVLLTVVLINSSQQNGETFLPPSPECLQTQSIIRDEAPAVSFFSSKKIGKPTSMSNEEVGDYFLTSKTILGDSSSWVGFSSYANQLHRQYSLSGFVLNILVVGIEEFELSMTMNITVVDGFGDQVDNVDMNIAVQKATFSAASEVRLWIADITRASIFSHHGGQGNPRQRLLESLRKIDILAMSKLDKVINLIPVIGRAEILTLRELSLLKGRSSIPFAVIGALLQHNNGSPQSAPLKCREYPWGKINIESDEYYDFLKFKQVLISDHSEELRRKATILYEIYRADILSKKPTSPPKKYNIRPITIS